MDSRVPKRSRFFATWIVGALLLSSVGEASAAWRGYSACAGFFKGLASSMKGSFLEFREELKTQGPKRLFIRERKPREKFSWGIFMDPLTSPIYLPGEVFKWKYAPAIVPDLLIANYLYSKVDEKVQSTKAKGLESAEKSQPGIPYLMSFGEYGAISFDELMKVASEHVSELKSWSSSDPDHPHLLARQKEFLRLGILGSEKESLALDRLAREAWNKAYRASRAAKGKETFPELLDEVWSQKLKSSPLFSKKSPMELSMLSTLFMPVVQLHGKSDVEWTAALFGAKTSIHGNLKPFADALGKADLPSILLSASATLAAPGEVAKARQDWVKEFGADGLPFVGRAEFPDLASPLRFDSAAKGDDGASTEPLSTEMSFWRVLWKDPRFDDIRQGYQAKQVDDHDAIALVRNRIASLNAAYRLSQTQLGTRELCALMDQTALFADLDSFLGKWQTSRKLDEAHVASCRARAGRVTLEYIRREATVKNEARDSLLHEEDEAVSRALKECLRSSPGESCPLSN